MNLVRILAVSAVTLASLLPLSALAQSFTLKDIAGREITFDKPVERVVLGEGRLLYAIAAIEKEDPFAKIVGWRNDLWTTDKDSFDAYIAKFPKGKDLPFLGNLADGTLQIEAVIGLKPDVMLLPVSTQKPAEEMKLEDTLNSVGTRIVYVDFRENILTNTGPSLRILGTLFGKQQRAEAVADYWQQQLARVTDTLKAANPPKPTVFMYRAPGYVECCGTFGPDNFGLMVTLAGGHNLGSDFLPGYVGSMNPEQVVASNPDIIVATGSNWSGTKDVTGYVNVGPNAAIMADQSRKMLNELMQNPAFTGSKALQTKRSMRSGTSSIPAPTSSLPCKKWRNGSTPMCLPTSIRMQPFRNSPTNFCRFLISQAIGSTRKQHSNRS